MNEVIELVFCEGVTLMQLSLGSVLAAVLLFNWRQEATVIGFFTTFGSTHSFNFHPKKTLVNF